jgi:MiaB-like tRNA modifying enzyme
MPKIYIETYGCSANLSDAEMMAGLLKENGFIIAGSPDDADLNILCTCNVKLPTAQRMVFRLKKLAKLGKPLVVAGCMPKNEREAVEKVSPDASLVGPGSVERMVEAVRMALKGEKCIFLKDLRKPKLCLPKVKKNPVVGITQISQGCLSACSYCCVKLARGELFSYPPELIKKEVEQSVKGGCREIWLTSQDTGCYGRDMGADLPKLLRKICKIEGRFFVRVGMMNPAFLKDIVDGLVEVYKEGKIFKFLHIPVQSGSDRVLRLMRRGYSVKDFEKIVSAFRKGIPEITIWTDVIAGFPGETEEDFGKTMDLIRRVKPDFVNVSKFGVRPGTEAGRMKQLPSETIKERSRRMAETVDRISLEKNEKWAGWEGKILIDEYNRKKGTWVGRNFAYKPVVVKDNLKIGDFVRVKIVSAEMGHLVGEV